MLSGPGQFAEKNKRSELPRNSVACIAKGMHVFHLQSEVHQQLHRDSRISHPARNRSRTTHGSQFLGLLEKRNPAKKKEDKAQKKEIF